MAQGFYKRTWQGAGDPSSPSDTQSAIYLVNNPVYHNAAKHINVQYYFIHILLKDGVLSLEKIHASQNPADILIKVVMVEKAKNMFNLCVPSRLRIRS